MLDIELMKKYPNRYNIQPKDIKNLKILDWDRLKEHTWYNKAMWFGSWWCHIEGANLSGPYDDEDEFWIGFNEKNNKISYHFESHCGSFSYTFKRFYDSKTIHDKYDMNMQANTIRWLNKMIDEGILGI